MIFDLATFLDGEGVGRRLIKLQPTQTFYSQGDSANAIFYLRAGRAKLTVVSPGGKEATIALLASREFIGEESLASLGALYLATATAIEPCSALKIGREEMIRVMHEESDLSEIFWNFLLTRSMRTQADLIDQLCNSSEKRLARILLILSEFGEPGKPEHFVLHITQEALAEMVGTTRSRVSSFMNRFRDLGLIEYNGGIRVHKALLNILLHDHLPEPNASQPADHLPRPVRKARRAKGA
jgi:CRP/FNR family cyclic AMP-dependent transcriptional regulator